MDSYDIYDEYDELYGFIQNNTNIYYYVRDYIGNILGIVDNLGNLIVKYNYDAYGNTISITGENIYNPFIYKGYYYDNDIEMYYCHNRFYNPKWRRWLTPDSPNYLNIDTPSGMNLFIYCNNNPVMYSDGDGHLAISAILIGLAVGFGIGAGAGAITGLVSGLINHDSGCQLAGDVFGGALVGGALGLATTAGGFAGIGAISGWTLAGTIAGTSALSFGAGVAQSSINQYTHTGRVDLKESLIDGGITAFQSLVSFGIGAAMSYSGLWKSLGQKQYTGSIKLFSEVASNKFSAFVNGNLLYLEQNGLQIVGREFVKNVFTIPYVILKKYL